MQEYLGEEKFWFLFHVSNIGCYFLTYLVLRLQIGATTMPAEFQHEVPFYLVPYVIA